MPASPESSAPVPVRPASTLMPLRDAPDGSGLEVCLLRRNPNSTWVAGLALFAGGGVDPRDADPALLAHCTLPAGIADAAALSGGPAPWVAAVREAYEEIGLLLATDATGAWAHHDPARAARLSAARAGLEAERRTLADLLASEGLTLRLDLLRFIAHWVTPPGQSRRYDTRFYLAASPADGPADPDGTEIVSAGWIAPSRAIAQQESGELPMLPPTLGALHWLAPHGSVVDAIAAADALGEIPRFAPGSIASAATRAQGDDPLATHEPAAAATDDPASASA